MCSWRGRGREEVKSAADVRDLVPPVLRRFTSPHDAIPRTHLLSNGRYAVMVTAAGSGYSRWRDLAVTRWREDVTRDSGVAISSCATSTAAPCGRRATSPAARKPTATRSSFAEDHAEFSPARRLDRDRPDDRRVGGARRGDPPRIADESRLARSRDRAHLVRRDRPRAAGGRCRSPCLPEPVRADRVRPGYRGAPGHPPASDPPTNSRSGRRMSRRSRRRPAASIQYETDRARFLGRGRSVRSPVSVIDGRPLSNTVGSVLDPIFSLRCRVRLAPGATARVALLHGRGRVTRGGPGPGRQVPRGGHLRTGGDPGLDAGAGAAPSPRDRGRRGPPLPAPGQPDPLFGPVAAARRRACWRGTSRGRPAYGLTASQATCRSSWCGSTKPRTSTSCGNCSARSSTGA